MPVLTYPADTLCACGQPAIVGFGKDNTPLCKADFEAELKRIKSVTTAAQAALTPGDR